MKQICYNWPHLLYQALVIIFTVFFFFLWWVLFFVLWSTLILSLYTICNRFTMLTWWRYAGQGLFKKKKDYGEELEPVKFQVLLFWSVSQLRRFHPLKFSWSTMSSEMKMRVNPKLWIATRRIFQWRLISRQQFFFLRGNIFQIAKIPSIPADSPEQEVEKSPYWV